MLRFFLDSAMRRNFCSNLNLMWGFLLRFLLRSDDFRSNLSLMLWFFFDFCLDLLIFAQIWVWCGDFKLDPVTQTQTEADRPDRYPPETDPTRPEVVDGRRRVVKHFTRFWRVGSGLGTNPTRTDPWTALQTTISLFYLVLLYHFPCLVVSFPWWPITSTDDSSIGPPCNM